MKKFTAAMGLLTISGGMLFAQNGVKTETQAERSTVGAETAKRTHVIYRSASHQPENTLYSEDFASGIPASWTNVGYDGTGTVLDSALWEYRGPNTTPDVSLGSRGAYDAGTPMTSATASNGFMIFDSDYLDNNGVAGNFGLGKAPAPHVGTLTSGTIDLTGYPYVELAFSSYHRYFEGRALVAFSSDGGLTWPDTIAVHPNLAVNSATATNVNVGINASDFIGNESQAKFRFIFDGTYDDPGANGSGQGYYHWQIDDVAINELPKHELRFTEWNGAPAQDVVFGPASGSSKMGILAYDNTQTPLLDQLRTMEFDANAYNYGWGDVNAVELNVDIVDANGTLISTFTSTGSVNLQSGDTANYNTLNTYGNIYKPTQAGTYGMVYRATGDSAEVVSDTLNFYVTGDLMSTDFNGFDNRIGTPQLGDDGSAIANRIDLIDDTYMTGVQIGLSASTVAGGVIEVEVYDTVGFDFTAGFPQSALVGASQSYTIKQTDIDNGYFSVPVSDGVNSYVELTAPSYYVSVKMYSNAGANVVYLRNDQTFPQPSRSSIMYNTDDARWWVGYSNSLTLNAPHIRAVVTNAVGIGEDELKKNITVGPNPATDFINVAFSNIDGDYNMTMTDMAGRVVSNQEVNVNGATQSKVDVSSLAAGVYVLNISNGTANVTYKISVQ